MAFGVCEMSKIFSALIDVCCVSHRANRVRTIALLGALPLRCRVVAEHITDIFVYLGAFYYIILIVFWFYAGARACVFVWVSAFKLVGFVSFISFYSFHIILCAYCRLSGSSTKAAFVARVFAIVFWAVFEYIDAFTLLFHLFSSPLQLLPSPPLPLQSRQSYVRFSVANCALPQRNILHLSSSSSSIRFVGRKKNKLNHFHWDTHFSLASCHPLLLLFRRMLLSCSDIPQIELSGSISGSGSKGQTRKITVEKW